MDRFHARAEHAKQQRAQPEDGRLLVEPDVLVEVSALQQFARADSPPGFVDEGEGMLEMGRSQQEGEYAARQEQTNPFVAFHEC